MARVSGWETIQPCKEATLASEKGVLVFLGVGTELAFVSFMVYYRSDAVCVFCTQ